MTKKRNRVLQQFRLPAELSKMLAVESQKTSKTKTQIVVEALRLKLATK